MASINDFQAKYVNGKYAEDNPTWHVEDSTWKASKILCILKRNNITSNTICEVGCGAGGVISELQKRMANGDTTQRFFFGYDISPHAIELCKPKENSHLHFEVKSLADAEGLFFDVLLVIDVMEHVDDYYGFLKALRNKATFKVFHIPLDISVNFVLRPHFALKTRKSLGHIHYFTKELALQVLKDSGYVILDHFYTMGLWELPALSRLAACSKLPYKLLSFLNQDLAARIFGASLMVLAQ